MLNTNKCGGCQNYDPVMRGTNRGVRETDWAWCAKHSVYPHKEGPGQLFPVGIKRLSEADAAKPARPKIVRKDVIVCNCTHFQPKAVALSKEALLQQLKDQKHGGHVV